MFIHRSGIKRTGLVAMAGIFMGLTQLSANAQNCPCSKPPSEIERSDLDDISDEMLSGGSEQEAQFTDYSVPAEKGESTVNTHARWSLDLFLGSALNIPTPLSVHQSGEERIFLYARYREKPFTGSPYYAWRIAKWNGDQAWEFELVHHKLYLANKSPEIQRFEISHGYNLVTVNRAWHKTNGVIIRVGAGIVLTHPETIVRGKKLPWGEGLDGFYLSGSTVQVAAAKKLPISDSVFFVVEGKFTASYAHIPIQDGSAYVPNLAFHGLLGLGCDFNPRITGLFCVWDGKIRKSLAVRLPGQYFDLRSPQK